MRPGSPLEALGESCPSLDDLLRGAARAAASEAGILVLGEAGSGRSTLARALHAESGRADRPLVEVDVAAIPSSLFESEFFGYEAGAFTGAEKAMRGRVARAESGSLLLDHVEEIPLAAQPKLLRLLAENLYAPLGGPEARADVRYLAVGSHDLPERVARGNFREDLYYRLEVVVLRLLPLRERRQDIPALVSFFLADLGERFGRGELRLASQSMDWMRAYSWPGNLREMRNVLERAAVLTAGRELRPPPPLAAAGRPRTLAEAEREEIVKALAHTRGHQGRAAELLGISRKSLWERRKRYGLP